MDESVEADRVEVEGEFEEENSVAVLIRSNGNLTTFSDNLEKSECYKNWNRTTGQGKMGDEPNVPGEGIAKSSEMEKMELEKSSAGRGNEIDQTTKDQAQLEEQGYTIFAPSDDANLASSNYLMVDQRLPQDQLKKLIRDSNGTYPLKTMQGENISAALNGEIIVLKDVKGNEARVVETDEKAGDGVLYIIDGVLMTRGLTRNQASNRN